MIPPRYLHRTSVKTSLRHKASTDHCPVLMLMRYGTSAEYRSVKMSLRQDTSMKHRPLRTLLRDDTSTEYCSVKTSLRHDTSTELGSGATMRVPLRQNTSVPHSETQGTRLSMFLKFATEHCSTKRCKVCLRQLYSVIPPKGKKSSAMQSTFCSSLDHKI
ncbi:hypothetical protein BaRGS_00029775 [Batillaria attramentaria]|uniref:Uncharacterized protein n=1 Tax=Batillaria attramentaria TaxID=370345 RepID=A0ABD0JVB9_9CAEN